MANNKFDAKSFNAEAFGYMVDHVPNLNMNELKKSKALTGNPDIKAVFSGQDGTGYARLAMRGLADGDAVNYDGQTDITATSTKTFEQGVVVVGRAKGWVERDFSYDITGGVDFMGNIAQQVAEYKDWLDQNTLLAILDGIFSMTGAKNQEFVEAHTTEIDTPMTATTLNSAISKACGANKKKFALVFMHSTTATNLENLNVLEHLKYTDPNGVTRELELGSWNGKLVVIDDSMPAIEGYVDAAADDVGALKVVADSATPATGEIKQSEVQSLYIGQKTLTTGDYIVMTTKYISYALGEGAIAFENIGAKTEYEMDRDPAKNGGEDTLYIRQRKAFAPYGISYEKKSQASNSPTDTELKNGANWSLVHSGESTAANRSYINHKAIPIARIISRG